MSSYVFFALMFILLTLHAVWMALFALEVFFETSLSTASERARVLVKYLGFGFLLELALGLTIFFFVRSIG